MTNIRNVMKFGEFAKSMVDNYVRYKSSQFKIYQHLHHIMKKHTEVQVPSETEIYTFMLDDGWKITYHNNQVIIIVKQE